MTSNHVGILGVDVSWLARIPGCEDLEEIAFPENSDESQLCRASIVAGDVTTAMRQTGVSVGVRPTVRDGQDVVMARTHHFVAGVLVDPLPADATDAPVALKEHRKKHTLRREFGQSRMADVFARGGLLTMGQIVSSVSEQNLLTVRRFVSSLLFTVRRTVGSLTGSDLFAARCAIGGEFFTVSYSVGRVGDSFLFAVRQIVGGFLCAVRSIVRGLPFTAIRRRLSGTLSGHSEPLFGVSWGRLYHQRCPSIVPPEPQPCEVCHGTGEHDVTLFEYPGSPSPVMRQVQCPRCGGTGREPS